MDASNGPLWNWGTAASRSASRAAHCMTAMPAPTARLPPASQVGVMGSRPVDIRNGQGGENRSQPGDGQRGQMVFDGHREAIGEHRREMHRI